MHTHRPGDRVHMTWRTCKHKPRSWEHVHTDPADYAHMNPGDHKHTDPGDRSTCAQTQEMEACVHTGPGNGSMCTHRPCRWEHVYTQTQKMGARAHKDPVGGSTCAQTQ